MAAKKGGSSPAFFDRRRRCFGGRLREFLRFRCRRLGWSGFETVVPMPDERAIEDVEIRRDRISRLIEEVTKPYETNEPHVAKTQSSAVG
jgi:hypothetical protein